MTKKSIMLTVIPEIMQPEIRELYRGIETVSNNNPVVQTIEDLRGVSFHSVDGVLYPMDPTACKYQTPKSDAVNHPSHYTFGKIECIEALEAQCTPEEFIAFLRLSIAQYIWRAGRKHKTIEDIEKADFYIQLLKKKAKEQYERESRKDTVQGGNKT